MECNWSKTIDEGLSEFSEMSSIHGVRYLGEKKRAPLEKIFWSIAIILSFVGCSVMIYMMYEKWTDNPVVVTFASKKMAISELPFPAVTICPVDKLNHDNLNFAKVFEQYKMNKSHLMSMSQRNKFEAATQICNWVGLPDEVRDEIKNSYSPFDTSKTVKYLEDVSIKVNETLRFCSWRGFVKPCDEYFTEIITEEGFCYTFNMLDLSELLQQDNLTDDFKYFNNYVQSTNWTLQGGYTTSQRETYPHRVLGSGEHGGLDLLLAVNKTNEDYICGTAMKGFKIIFHTPGEIPQVTTNYFRIASGQGTTINIRPTVIQTSTSLKRYTYKQRQCYFDGEKDLQFFKVYTQSNCEMECLANYTLRKCGCVKFSMPRLNVTRICGLQEFDCGREAEIELFEDMNYNLLSDDEHSRKREKCHCKPACTSINYYTEMSQVEFDFKKVVKPKSYGGQSMLDHEDLVISYVAIYFKQKDFLNMKREELYGWRDFIANIGGLMGLFMGVSVISLAEIIYHLTLRFAVNLRINKKKSRVVRSIHVEAFKPRQFSYASTLKCTA